MKPVDAEMMKMLDEAAVGYRLVLTKADKIKASELAATLAGDRGRGAQAPRRLPGKSTSPARRRSMGIAELRAAVLGDVRT